MARKKKLQTEHYVNPNWEIMYEYKHGRDVIVPGTRIKIKKEKGEFVFQRVVHHKEKDVMWIDCYSKTGYRAFYVDRLKCIVKPKRKYVKKNV
jgi:hypothetical protein